MIEGKCEYCGKEVYSKYRSLLPRFCSKECAIKWNWEHVRKRKEFVTKQCSYCGKDILVEASDRRLKEGQINFFCNHKCESDYRKDKLEKKVCPICGKEFHNRKTITCSSECGYKLIKMNKYFEKRGLPNTGYKDYLSLLKKEEDEKERKRNKPNVYKGREKEYLKEYSRSHKKERLEYERNRMMNDEVYRYKVYIRKFICHCFRRRRLSKDDKTEDILGCSLEDFKSYISSKFKEGMSWENYGKWQIDHIIPLSTANTNEEVKRLCHYTNLQPLWAEENREKSNKID